MRTTVPHRKIGAVNIKHADGTAFGLNDFAFAGRYLRNVSDNMTSHAFLLLKKISQESLLPRLLPGFGVSEADSAAVFLFYLNKLTF
jgi:hypothetical protein